MRENLAEKLPAAPALDFPDLNSTDYGLLQNSLCLNFAAISENVALARSLVAALIVNCRESGWDMTLSALEEIKVAVSEAVSNAIIHGYPNTDGRAQVHMELWQYQQALVVRWYCRCAEGYGTGVYNWRGAFGAGFCVYEFIYGRGQGKFAVGSGYGCDAD